MTRDATGPELPPADAVRLRQMIGEARSVLFDFDGPICRLFAGHPSRHVARHLKRWLAERDRPDLAEAVAGLSDPILVLRTVGEDHPADPLVALLEKELTKEEEQAALTARPALYADPLVRTLVAVGRRLGITTNNSPSAVARYLDSRGLADCFGGHIHGRTPDPALLKPHPDCLTRALRSLDCAPHEALMIGDAPADAMAAHSAKVAFLGYAHDEHKATDLYKAGAPLVIDSLAHVLHVARTAH